MRSTFRTTLIATVLAALAPSAAFAQAFPGKVVRIVIPFSLGGSNDLTARVLLPHLSERWKQQVIVDPHVGAASTVGATYVARSAPPMAEAAPGFEAVAWFGMFVPRGTPPAVVRKIRDDIADILKTPAVIKGMHGIGGDPSGMPTEEFAKMVRSEIEKWSKVAKAAGFKPQ